MSYVLDEIINQKLKTAFAGLGLDTKYAAAKTSDRPDLSAVSYTHLTLPTTPYV